MPTWPDRRYNWQARTTGRPLFGDDPIAALRARRTRTVWFNDFRWADGRVEIRKTGIRIRFDRHLIHEVANWLGYFAILGLVALGHRLKPGRRRAIWYGPDRARPWYLMRGAAIWAGYGVATSPAAADAAFYFDDATRGAPEPFGGCQAFNARCTDISKSHVATVFASVFGYPLSVDPTRANGEIVEKAEKNGVHDGCIVRAPCQPRPGYVYQRLIDTRDDGGLAYDLRTPCVGGAPVVVWIKAKAAGQRFAIHNARATLRHPQSVFSEAELATIRAFNQRMGLDWGGLDILRDRADGRLYVVDVNKTDLGPVIALGWRDKIASMGLLAKALEGLLDSAGAEASDLPPDSVFSARPLERDAIDAPVRRTTTITDAPRPGHRAA